MTTEQREAIKKDIQRMIPHIARLNGVHNDEVESVIIDEFTDKDDFCIICWPEVQELMVHEDFYNNAVLMNEPWAVNDYGSQTYLINKQWLMGL